MSKINVTLTTEDGTVIQPGSLHALELYTDEVWLMQSVLDEATPLIALLPPEMEDTVRQFHQQTGRKLDVLRQLVTRIRDDSHARGLETAISDARQRQDLPREP